MKGTHPVYRGRDMQLYRQVVGAVKKLRGRKVYGDRNTVIGDIVDAGVRHELAILEVTENDGKPFPESKGLRRGQPKRIRKGEGDG